MSGTRQPEMGVEATNLFRYTDLVFVRAKVLSFYWRANRCLRADGRAETSFRFLKH
jgi:hypothetical protein